MTEAELAWPPHGKNVALDSLLAGRTAGHCFSRLLPGDGGGHGADRAGGHEPLVAPAAGGASNGSTV